MMPSWVKVSCHVEAFGFGVGRSDVVQIAAVCDTGSLFVPVYHPALPDDVQKRLGFLTQSRSGKRLDEEEVLYYGTSNDLIN